MTPQTRYKNYYDKIYFFVLWFRGYLFSVNIKNKAIIINIIIVAIINNLMLELELH